MSLFTKKQGRANYGAFLKMRLTNSCYPPTVQLLSLTTRKMDGKRCVFIKKWMARQCTTQSGCSGGASYTYVSRELQSQVSSQHSITMEKGLMWLVKTSANGNNAFGVSGDTGYTHRTHRYTGPLGLFRHTNSKNGTLVRCYLQGAACVSLGRNDYKNETEFQIC